jgi:hypothetical protein
LPLLDTLIDIIEIFAIIDIIDYFSLRFRWHAIIFIADAADIDIIIIDAAIAALFPCWSHFDKISLRYAIAIAIITPLIDAIDICAMLPCHYFHYSAADAISITPLPFSLPPY